MARLNDGLLSDEVMDVVVAALLEEILNDGVDRYQKIRDNLAEGSSKMVVTVYDVKDTDDTETGNTTHVPVRAEQAVQVMDVFAQADKESRAQ